MYYIYRPAGIFLLEREREERLPLTMCTLFEKRNLTIWPLRIFFYIIVFTLNAVQLRKSQKCIQKRVFWCYRISVFRPFGQQGQNWRKIGSIINKFWGPFFHVFMGKKEKQYFSKIAKWCRQTYWFWPYLLLANFVDTSFAYKRPKSVTLCAE